ncbi:MAG: DUF3261 domain-containing protein [Desulfobacteraceae bacterium]|nr:DUF3261 domain-containing protein [Desulfobacteraceae bacterium]
MNKKKAYPWHWKELKNSSLTGRLSGRLTVGRGALLLAACFLLFIPGCRSFAPIEPAAPALHEDAARRCRDCFLDNSRQLVQSLTAYLPDGDVRDAIAVMRIYPENRKIRCVIMSAQGIVLFDGEYDGRVSVSRAVSPFDEKKFANEMFADIRLALLPPPGRLLAAGSLLDGTPICRYARKNDEGYCEVRLSKDGGPEIRQYTKAKKLLKTVRLCYAPACENAASGGGVKIASRITIYHHGLFDYRLELKLLETESLSPD